MATDGPGSGHPIPAAGFVRNQSFLFGKRIRPSINPTQDLRIPMGLWEQSGKSADEWSETTGSRPREGTPEALVFADTAPSVFGKPDSSRQTEICHISVVVFINRPGTPISLARKRVLRSPHPEPRNPIRDTLQARPCALGCRRPWRQTVPDRATRFQLLGLCKTNCPSSVFVKLGSAPRKHRLASGKPNHRRGQWRKSNSASLQHHIDGRCDGIQSGTFRIDQHHRAIGTLGQTNPTLTGIRIHDHQ